MTPALRQRLSVNDSKHKISRNGARGRFEWNLGPRLRRDCQMKSWISALAAMSMKLAAPRVGCSPSMKSDVESP